MAGMTYLLEARGLTRRFGGVVALDNLDLVVVPNEIMGLIGPNGVGKTTLLRTVIGELPPVSGQVQIGHNVRIGYYSQTHAGLNMERSIIDEIRQISALSEEGARTFLGRFLFSRDDVFKAIGTLSGGERSRVALAKLTLQGSNLMILDEPTNHLDLQSRQLLEEVLNEFEGTLLFVSHDRYFIDKLATRVFEIGEERVEVFPGNYEDYLWRKQGGTASVPTLDDVPKAGAPRIAAKTSVQPVNGGQVSQSAPADEPKAKRLNPIKRKQLQDRVHELEEEINRAESAIAHCETALQNFVSADQSQRQSQELDQHKASHAELIREWEDLAQALQESD